MGLLSLWASFSVRMEPSLGRAWHPPRTRVSSKLSRIWNGRRLLGKLKKQSAFIRKRHLPDAREWPRTGRQMSAWECLAQCAEMAQTGAQGRFQRRAESYRNAYPRRRYWERKSFWERRKSMPGVQARCKIFFGETWKDIWCRLGASSPQMVAFVALSSLVTMPYTLLFSCVSTVDDFDSPWYFLFSVTASSSPSDQIRKKKPPKLATRGAEKLASHSTEALGRGDFGEGARSFR